jgi:hypothetical protein
MLRKNQKEHQNSEEVMRLQQENESLIERLQEEVEGRQKEIEFWVSERASMREIIE